MRTYKKDYLDERDLSQYPTLALRLRKELNAKSMTLNKLSEITGISSSVLKNYTEKDVDVGYKNLEKIANALSVSIDYLLGRSNAATANEEVSAICAYTGLSAQAVDFLHSTASHEDRLSAGFQNEITSQLIENGYYKTFCVSIEKYFMEVALAEKTVADALNNLVPKRNVYEAEKSVRYAQFDVTENIKCILDETAKVPNIYAFELQYQMTHSKEVQNNGEHNEANQ